MFAEYLFDCAQASYVKRIILVDEDQILNKVDWKEAFIDNGYEILPYENDLRFRIDYEESWKAGQNRLAFAVSPEVYVPYDIRTVAWEFHVSFQTLFPKLNGTVLKEKKNLNLDLSTMAYQENFDDLRSVEMTRDFLSERVYSRKTISKYLDASVKALTEDVNHCSKYSGWLRIAERQAELQVMAAENGLKIDTTFVDGPFQNFILHNFGKLSAELNPETPVLVSRAMEFMHDHSQKFVIIVMDGMSEFDWQIISRSFMDIKYRNTDAFAMIPTVTSISRQCLVSGKYPKELVSPWTTSKEKNEFIVGAKRVGYADSQIAYGRGYDTDFGMSIRCGCVIINDVDDMMHGQKQGREGMYQDISLLAKGHKLHDLVKRLVRKGFDVYVSADHGNTWCIGMGRLTKTGVETETKSHRMVVLKDYADKESLIHDRHMVEFPKYYLDKQFDYLICSGHESMDAKGEQVITHGGITLEEVVVPFISVKVDENNG
jgi:hypothetical protein